jgi:two-component system cell cycle sensor histidine kinase/response regulator CckA
MSGHEVLTAANGLEGLAVFRSYAKMIDLIITDLQMPVMDGYEFIGRIRDSKPDAKLICMSGFSEQGPPKGVAFLPKPFLPQDARALVNAALGAPVP